MVVLRSACVACESSSENGSPLAVLECTGKAKLPVIACAHCRYYVYFQYPVIFRLDLPPRKRCLPRPRWDCSNKAQRPGKSPTHPPTSPRAGSSDCRREDAERTGDGDRGCLRGGSLRHRSVRQLVEPTYQRPTNQSILPNT